MRKAALVLIALLGGQAISALAADFDGDSRADIGTFRGSDALWHVPGITLFFFGSATDILVPGDYNGDGKDEGAIYRPANGLWAVRNVTRQFIGGPGEIPIGGGSGGLKTYDYVVRPGDALDLKRALESDVYRSVFIPNATYSISGVVTVDHVTHIAGEGNRDTNIRFPLDGYLLVKALQCHIEDISFYEQSTSSCSMVVVDSNLATIENCVFRGIGDSDNAGLEQDNGGSWLRVINCFADHCSYGFSGYPSDIGSLFANCQAFYCGVGFYACENISNSYVVTATDGYYGCKNLIGCKVKVEGIHNPTGFRDCNQLSACTADCSTYSPDAGFRLCSYLSSCVARNASWGFQTCSYISSSRAISCDDNWPGCTYRDTGSCPP